MTMETVNQIETSFDEPKTVAAASVLLKLAGGSMQHMRLIKLLYMADRLAWDRLGMPISGDRYSSMDHGPVLSGTYNLIKAGWESKSVTSLWNQVVKQADDVTVHLAGEADEEELSDAEHALLVETHNRFKHITNVFRLVNHLHVECEEWEDPKGSSRPISPIRILEVLGKTPPDIAAVAAKVGEASYLKEAFGAR